MRQILCAALIFSACRADPHTERSSQPAPTAEGHFVLAGGSVVQSGRAERMDIEVRAGRIVAMGSVSDAAPRVNISGKFVAAAVIDSHVHLAYLPRAEELARGGVLGAVDLSAPRSFLAELAALPLEVVAAGPMITAAGGYPTQSWGRDGYGFEVSTPETAKAAVTSLLGEGARVIKVPLTEAPALDDASLDAIVKQAHAAKVPVVAHALGGDDVARAARAGVDALAHTPVESLSPATIKAWQGRAVVSTLSAFGGPTAQNNLQALRAQGATVLYGTDFGNTSQLGISRREIEALANAGLSGSEILASATRAPAEFFGFDELGSLRPGKRASLLILERNPLQDPTTLATPSEVYRDGEKL